MQASPANRVGRSLGRASTIRLVGALAIACALAALRSASAAMPDDQAEQIRQHVAAGEFGPALALAQQAAPGDRDAVLATIAKAQAGVGARSASYNTLAGMSDGRTRSRALDEMAAMPARGAMGGGANFGPLIALITNTVSPDSWEDTESGAPGRIMPFPNGVYVDAEGMMRRVAQQDDGQLAALRRAERHERVGADVRRSSPLRKVSLARLEREIQLRLAAGEPLDEEMLVLAGLKRVQYVLAYPESGDVVLAGPASDWTLDRESRYTSVDDGQPIVRLDHLVTLLRRQESAPDKPFYCSIVPTNEGMAKAHAFLEKQSGAALKPGQKGRWLEELRKQVGRQAIVFDGIDPGSSVAQVLVDADHHMKLIGIGLAPGTLKVPSYLSMIKVGRGESPPALDLLRWWFTLNYDAVVASADRDAFEIRGQGVQVLSENELLTATGQQVHTGKAEPLNQEFARNFTKDFAALCAKYPVYAELRNVFDLALVAALVDAEGLAERVGWHPTCFTDGQRYPMPTETAPRFVDTVLNHRVVNRTDILAAVSGGVSVDPRNTVKRENIQTETSGRLNSDRARNSPVDVARRGWWWD
ncbi:MAG: DUF1598 domain-containing protein [Planctomycetia bacterium]|nr:DUF1598 domain-containing protein [Planctomycetia bacterium]